MNVPKLRVLWSFARPHRRTLALGLLLALVGSAMGLATPMVTKAVLDALATSGSLLQPVAALLVLLVVGSAIGYRQWAMLGAVGERVVLDARESMIRRLLRATVPDITRRPPGEFVARVTSDTVLLREAATSSVIGLVNGMVMLAGTLVLMGVLDLVLLGVTLGAVAVVAFLFLALMPAIATGQAQAQDSVGRMGGVLEGALRAIKTVKASRAEDRQAERIIADARTSAAHGVRVVKKEALAWTIAWSGVQLAIILVLGIGAWRVASGALEVSSLIAFLLYSFGLLDPVTELSQNVTALQSGLAAAERMREVDALEVEKVRRGGVSALTRRASDGAPVLELRGVTAAYGPDAEPALRGVDLAIPRRGHTALVGPSGAGKTTLFSLLLCFLRPREGEVFLDGVPYAELTPDEVRARLAYVEQDAPVVPGTIRDNLLYARPDASEEELRRVLEEVRLAAKVDGLPHGLDTELTSASVSGGERQRIALARALLREPEVLLLDEATAQLDALTEAAVHDCVRRRAAEGAVVTIAHRLSTVMDADTIVVVDRGHIRARGTHEELLASDELYRRLVEALRIEGAGVAA
ncbi:ABC transporter ATP-binding protein [Thermoactinospora rubra]|uniref:ABC transporter ATP-binding protein n=1 Tax=Thermoactinospora rubra TaxID=1088767 RepID=UPI0019806630|nr:ABC transporter ATP-binding protein [Thermoactinospora rubra]